MAKADRPTPDNTRRHGVLASKKGVKQPWRQRGRELTEVFSYILLCYLVFGISGQVVASEASSVSAAQVANPDTLVEVDIPASRCIDALIQLLLQAKVEVQYLDTKIIKEIQTNAVKGSMRLGQALAKMFEGTGVTFDFSPTGRVFLYPPGAQQPEHRENKAEVTSEESSAEAKPQDVGPSLGALTVTGTHIHGLDTVTAPRVELLRGNELKKQGYASVPDALHTVSQMSLAGPREDYEPGGTITNYNRGISANIRSLGPAATLVLVNGRRQPASGSNGGWVDVSAIPWSIVERIEVVPDGASAIYGADAIGGVVNIITRKDLSKAETYTRAALLTGGGNELLLAQLFAKHWEKSSVLLGYQFSEREALPTAARASIAQSNKLAMGGDDFDIFTSNPATIIDPRSLRAAYAIPANQDGRGLSISDLNTGANFENANAHRDLLPKRLNHSFYINSDSCISAGVTLNVEARFNQRDIAQELGGLSQYIFVPPTNAFFVNPFPSFPFVVLGYNFYDDLGPLRGVGRTRTTTTAAELTYQLANDWRAAFSASAGRERMDWGGHNSVDPTALSLALADPHPDTAFNPFGDGSNSNPATIESFRTTQKVWATSGIDTVTFTVDGSLGALGSRPVKIALGADMREESLQRGASLGSLPVTESAYRRRIAAMFAELATPIGHQLDLSMAGRIEKYSDSGSSFNPKLGLQWRLDKNLKFRGTWATSFRAPGFIDLDEKNRSAAQLLPVPDPRATNGFSQALLRVGSNSNLREETAVTWLVGADFAPSFAPGYTASVTYFDIRYDNRIVTPGPPLQTETLVFEDQWRDVITRNPSQSIVNTICSGAGFFGDPRSCISTPPLVLIDLRSRNLAKTEINGLDIGFHASLDVSSSSLGFSVNGTYFRKFAQALSSTSRLTEIRNTAGNPASVRLRGTADWYQHGEGNEGFVVSGAVNHTGAYRDNVSKPDRRVNSLTTIDLLLRYRTDPGSIGISNVELSLGAVNVLNTPPPFLNSILGYDPANAEPTGRLITFLIEKNW